MSGKIVVFTLGQDGRHGHSDLSRQPECLRLHRDRVLAARLQHNFLAIREPGADHDGLSPRQVRPDVRRLAEASGDDIAGEALGLRQLDVADPETSHESAAPYVWRLRTVLAPHSALNPVF